MNTLGQIFCATVLVGAISLVSIVFFGLRMDIRKITFYLISLASGTLLGGALLHLIPEAMEFQNSHALLWVAVGVFLFFVMEKLLIWRHCHHHQRPEDHSRPVAARMILVGDAIHNFIDGVIIAGSFMASKELGISITIGIILHEIPQELGDFGILIHGGYTMKQALLANTLIATTAVVAAVMTYFFFGTSTIVNIYVLPIAAGGLLYVALADLIPQLHEQVAIKHTLAQIVLLGIGFGLMLLLKH